VYFGATQEDLSSSKAGVTHSAMETDSEPAWHYRQISNQRNLLIEEEFQDCMSNHQFNEGKRTIRQAGCAAAHRFKEQIVTNFRYRYWPRPPKPYTNSSVTLATTRLMEMFIPEKFTDQSRTNIESKTVIQDQLLIRINNPVGNLASPTPEGIHQDGTQITIVTLVGVHNVTQLRESRL